MHCDARRLEVVQEKVCERERSTESARASVPD